MADDRELRALNPFDILDHEVARLATWLGTLDDEAWARPSRCTGWSVKDVCAHLAGNERYHRATLDDTIAVLFAELGRRGVTDLHSFNALAVADRTHRTGPQVLAEWIDAIAV